MTVSGLLSCALVTPTWCSSDGGWGDDIHLFYSTVLHSVHEGKGQVLQEYCCSFEALEGLVYPDFARCVVNAALLRQGGQRVGGLDFGFRNPFAAVWGILDRDRVLWLTNEHYVCERPLSYHIEHLLRDVGPETVYRC